MQRPATAAPSAHEKPIDRLGKYDLIAVLAHGGMGNVYLAVLQGPASFSKLLVVKELRPDVRDDEAHVTMFLHEARLAARLNHPNIVQTIEVGCDGQRRFIAMEYLDGQPLSRVLQRARKRATPLPLPMHFRIVADALTALEYAHSFADFDGTPLGVVHRDVSPQNVILTYEGHVKLIDFGVARTRVASQETRPGSLKGKLKYMSPEQAAGRVVDRRADVFAMGVVLWEGIVGIGPWEGLGELELLKRLTTGRVPRLGQRRPDLDPDLTAIVDQATDPDPGQRYPTAIAMRDELEHYVSVHGLSLGRELPAFVCSLFREDRRDLRALIDAQLRVLTESGPVELGSRRVELGSGPVELGSRRGELGSGSVELGSRRVELGSGPVELGSRRVELGSGPVERRSISGTRRTSAASDTGEAPSRGARVSPGLWVIAVAIASAGAFGTMAVNLSMRVPVAPPARVCQPTTEVRPASPASAPPAVSPPAAPTHAAHVSARATPSWAQLFVDGVPVGNPYVADWTPDGAIHHLSAEAMGYFGQSSAVSFDKDMVVDLSLERVPTARPAARPQAPAPAFVDPPISRARDPAPPAQVEGVAGPRSRRELDTTNPYP